MDLFEPLEVMKDCLFGFRCVPYVIPQVFVVVL